MDKDFDLKIRLNNIFWSLGFYTRLEVKLSEYASQKRNPTELTDLDVLGIRIMPDLSNDYLVADCTSNKHIFESPIQRVFWLRGVMDFFRASKGYLSLAIDNPISEAQRIVAHRLGVTILNETNLKNLEKRVVNSSLLELKLNKAESWLNLENSFANMSNNEVQPLLNFRNYRYWLNPTYQNIFAIITLVSKHKKVFEEINTWQKALFLDLLTLFTLSVLNMSGYVFRINPENPEVELKSYLYGGYAELERRQSILDDIKKLVEKIPTQKSFFNDALKLDPDYLPNLFDIAFRLLNKPFDSSQIPRFLQVILFEKILNKDENNYGVKYIETGFSDVTKKLAKDIAEFFCNATKITNKLLVDLY